MGFEGMCSNTLLYLTRRFIGERLQSCYKLQANNTAVAAVSECPPARLAEPATRVATKGSSARMAWLPCIGSRTAAWLAILSFPGCVRQSDLDDVSHILSWLNEALQMHCGDWRVEVESGRIAAVQEFRRLGDVSATLRGLPID